MDLIGCLKRSFWKQFQSLLVPCGRARVVLEGLQEHGFVMALLWFVGRAAHRPARAVCKPG